jgi:hypothetical protein
MQAAAFQWKGRARKEMEFVPDYSTALFVTPKRTYRGILSRVQWWQQTQPKQPVTDRVWKARHRSLQTVPGDQVLSLVGEQGIGKTWLLRHLAEDDGHVAPMAVYLDLEKRTEFPTPEDYVETVEDQIRQRHCSAGMVLLLDDVPPHLDDHVRALEDAVLRPHLMQRGSLAIMAPIHPSYVCWRAPALRGGEQYRILPFDESQTGEQVRRLQGARLTRNGVNVSDLHEASGGVPLLNYLLATRDRRESFELALEHWLSRVPFEERGCVQTYLEAVCTLDSLEQIKIQQMLDLYGLYRKEDTRVPARAVEVRNLLQKHALAWASPDSWQRIVLAGSVRRAAREVLRARDAELLAMLQRAV